MALKVYNSQSRAKEIFEPLNPPQVRMYVCGITAYDYCHLGHARAAVVFDVIFRYLKYKGFEVQYVRNFTDIDDKIIKRSQQSGKDWREICETFIQAFHEDMEALANLKPTREPRATQFIEAMQGMIAALMQKGLAYRANGDVFYSVRKFSTYGHLAHRNIEELEAGARVEVQEAKKDPLDFALWKGAKPGEPKWDSPWGEGRPGWHIECSAMSTQLLGKSLDIHGGGRDLIFPHHENERAQSEGTYDQPFAKYWIHNGFVNLNADKMSKSTGNFLTIRDVLAKYPHEAIRYFLLSSHYRSPLDFSDSNIKEALVAVDRVYETLGRMEAYAKDSTRGEGRGEGEGGIWKNLEDFPQMFEAAMDDDFNTAAVFGICFDLVRQINKFLDLSPSPNEVEEAKKKTRVNFKILAKCLGLFGQDPAVYLEARKRSALQEATVSEEVIVKKIEERKAARAKKNFKLADEIREELASQGVILKDNPDGSTTWTVK